MFITMLGDMTAFVALVFGYFFYWTVHAEFPPAEFDGRAVIGPGTVWPLASVGLGVAAWLMVILARRWNQDGNQLRQDVSSELPASSSEHKLLAQPQRPTAWRFYAAIALASCLGMASAAALAWGPYTLGMDPTHHVYSAAVCVLILWTAVHAVVGVVMLIYCAARRMAGRMDAVHDADIVNVTLCWHFLMLSIVITGLVIALFPKVA